MTVEQLWDKTWRIIAGMEQVNVEFLDAVNETTEQIFNYLWKRKSDLVRAPLVLRSFYIDHTGAWCPLPLDLRGLCEMPRFRGSTRRLEPALEEDRVRLAGTTGEPQYYELMGRKLYLYPEPEDTTKVLTGTYFKAPSMAQGFDDYLPFEGRFDAAYKAILLAISSQGIAINLEPLVEQHIGQLLEVRDYHAPVRSRVRDF